MLRPSSTVCLKVVQPIIMIIMIWQRQNISSILTRLRKLIYLLVQCTQPLPLHIQLLVLLLQQFTEAKILGFCNDFRSRIFVFGDNILPCLQRLSQTKIHAEAATASPSLTPPPSAPPPNPSPWTSFSLEATTRLGWCTNWNILLYLSRA